MKPSSFKLVSDQRIAKWLRPSRQTPNYKTFDAYTLHITKELDDVDRIITVPATTTIASLHKAIMVLASFTDEDFYKFYPWQSDRSPISNVLRKVGDEMYYEYNFQYPHEFSIRLESTAPRIICDWRSLYLETC